LEQEIPANCSVNVYFLADLNRALTRFGNRGYRAAQLEAAIMGGKFYLAAYAQRLGASGLTFFDDDVTEFFAPDAAGKSVMFLIALGRSVKRADISAM
jgi:nitroreductase